MKVLIADDEPFILQGLSVLIDWEAEGCEIVRKATNGMEALDYLRQNSVDLVISDIKMPEMSGLELLEKIRTEKISDAYFIFLSGYNEFAYAQKAMRYSCMDYLLKPAIFWRTRRGKRRSAKRKRFWNGSVRSAKNST